MEFRTIYLRAIAQAWVDPKFSTHLTSDPTGALQSQFGYHWPWGNACTLIIKPSDGVLTWNTWRPHLLHPCWSWGSDSPCIGSA